MDAESLKLQRRMRCCIQRVNRLKKNLLALHDDSDFIVATYGVLCAGSLVSGVYHTMIRNLNGMKESLSSYLEQIEGGTTAQNPFGWMGQLMKLLELVQNSLLYHGRKKDHKRILKSYDRLASVVHDIYFFTGIIYINAAVTATVVSFRQFSAIDAVIDHNIQSSRWLTAEFTNLPDASSPNCNEAICDTAGNLIDDIGDAIDCIEAVNDELLTAKRTTKSLTYIFILGGVTGCVIGLCRQESDNQLLPAVAFLAASAISFVGIYRGRATISRTVGLKESTMASVDMMAVSLHDLSQGKMTQGGLQ